MRSLSYQNLSGDAHNPLLLRIVITKNEFVDLDPFLTSSNPVETFAAKQKHPLILDYRSDASR